MLIAAGCVLARHPLHGGAHRQGSTREGALVRYVITFLSSCRPLIMPFVLIRCHDVDS